MLIHVHMYTSHVYSLKICMLISHPTNSCSITVYKYTKIVPEFMLYLTIVWNLLTFSFIQQRYAFFKNPIPAKTPSDLGGSKFVFRHVNFLSKLTFWWLNGFLADGYRTPYEQEHLGHLPKVCTVHVTISNVFWKHIGNILQT